MWPAAETLYFDSCWAQSAAFCDDQSWRWAQVSNGTCFSSFQMFINKPRLSLVNRECVFPNYQLRWLQIEKYQDAYSECVFKPGIENISG